MPSVSPLFIRGIRRTATTIVLVSAVLAPAPPAQAQDAPKAPVPQTPEQTPGREEGSVRPKPLPPGPTNLDPAILAKVQQKSLGILEEERDPYYKVLSIARDNNFRQMVGLARANEEERITELARENKLSGGAFPIFVDIFRNPERWHGKLVTLRGHARQVIFYPAGENAYGLKNLYEAWIYTDDSQSNPAVVICSEIHPGMPTGNEITEEVIVTGYFFKMYGYRAQDTTRIAPMILAQSLEWIPAKKPENSWAAPVIAVLVCIVFITGIWLLIGSSRRDRAFRDQLHREFSPGGTLDQNVISDERTAGPKNHADQNEQTS